MKTSLSLTGPALAALGISLMAISCDNKSAEADLEGRVIGYWAPDAEAMMKEKGPEEEDGIEALRTEMLIAVGARLCRTDVTIRLCDKISN